MTSEGTADSMIEVGGRPGLVRGMSV
jgi:hypothetical protein